MKNYCVKNLSIMNSFNKKAVFVLIFLYLFINIGDSQIVLPKIFTDNAIFQRNKEVLFYGVSKPDIEIKIIFNKHKFTTRSNEKGKWNFLFPPFKAGGPYKLSIITKNDTLILENILIGDIWLAGGQSNMEWFVEGAKNAEDEIAEANYPNIRIFEVPHKMSNIPLDELGDGEWKRVTPGNIRQFSAIGYFFGRNLHNKLDIPIGIISDNWGGTVIQTWMSKNAFYGLDNYEKEISKLKDIDLEKERQKGKGAFDSWLGDFYNLDKGIKDDKYIWATDKTDYENWKTMVLPGTWETSGDSSLVDKDGVVWFQRSFELSDIPDDDIELYLGAIDDSDKTWINGVPVGETYNRYNKNRKYKIEKGILQSGKNNIVVRVEDYIGAGGFTADADNFKISIGDQTISLVGKWHFKPGMFTKEPLPKNVFGPNIYPTLLYNGMINPIVTFPIKGVIWYQGESNVYNAFEYRDLFKRWIRDWRNNWKNNEMPVLWVQLANFGIPAEEPGKSQWAELREAQAMGLELPNTAMITAIDLGEANNIHPKNKQDVALRLSNAALNTVYGYKEVHYKGPDFTRMETNGNSVIITFKDVGEKLIVKDKYGYVKGFTIAGKDKKFHWAKAYIIGTDKVKVWSDDVSKPVSVRYAWADNPEDANLYNSYNLPAFPFRTDDWKE